MDNEESGDEYVADQDEMVDDENTIDEEEEMDEEDDPQAELDELQNQGTKCFQADFIGTNFQLWVWHHLMKISDIHKSLYPQIGISELPQELLIY